jgi:hypothetical protein
MSKFSRYMLAAAAAIALHSTTLDAQRKPPALDADIDTTYTLADGRQFATHGRYYRSQSGQLREDSPLGAIITDLKTGTITMLNFERKEAHVVKVAAQPRAKPKNMPAAVPFEEGTVEGRTVTKARVTGAGGEQHEAWTDKDLGLVVFSRVESPGFTMAKSLRNVTVREPQPSLFKVPKDFTVVDGPPPTPPPAR